jgi:hypothetical protein
MIAYRIHMRRPRFVLGAGLLFILGSCSSESVTTLEPFELDEPGSMSGELAVYIASFDDGTNETRYFLRDAKGDERRLRFDAAPAVDPGTRLRVWGSASGDTFEVRNFARTSPVGSTEIGTTASELIGVPPAPPRVMCVAQVVLNGGPPSANLSVESIEQQFHVGPKSVNAYYQENSYGKNSLGGKTYGPLPYSMSTCDTSGMAKNIKSTFQSLGFTGCQQYSFVMTPKATACAWAGLGQVGTSDKPATDTWYNNTLGCTATVQEPGHNYGMQHSSSITCTGAPFLDNPSSCTHGEYGDKFDTMGGGCRHMNAWQKLYQKWWGGCNAIRVRSTGTFNIYPTETPCNGVQAIQVMFPAAKTRSWQNVALTSYYLEYRAPLGFDQGLTPQVLLHTGVDPVLPTQTNPRGVKVWIINASGDANNPGLQTGAKYTDPAGGLDIVVKSIDATKAVVEITYGPGAGGSIDAGAADAGGADGGGTAPDAGGGGTPPAEPVICLDGMNTVFVPPGSDECIPIIPPVNPDGGGIVLVDAGPLPEAGPRVDARSPIDAQAAADAATDAGALTDVVDAAPPPLSEDAGTTQPPVQPPADNGDEGCGCRLTQRASHAEGRAAWGALLGLAWAARGATRKRRRSSRS